MQYKNKGLNFIGVAESRRLRIMDKNNSRRNLRKDNLLKIRNVELKTVEEVKDEKSDHQTDGIDCNLSRKDKLMKWRQERQIMKKIQTENKKPAFKVGGVAHDKTPRMSSLSSRLQPKVAEKVVEKAAKVETMAEPRRVTRSMTVSKSAVTVQKPITKKVPVKSKPASNKGSNKTEKKGKEKTELKSFAPDDFTFNVPGNLANFTWQPTPLTPRTSQQFISSSAESSGQPTLHIKPHLDVLADYNQNNENIDFASLKPKSSGIKLPRTPVKPEVPTKNDDQPETSVDKTLSIAGSTDHSSNEQKTCLPSEKSSPSKDKSCEKSAKTQPICLPSKYFEKCDNHEEPVFPDNNLSWLNSAESTPLNISEPNKTNTVDNLGTLQRKIAEKTLEKKLANLQSSAITEEMSKMNILETPVRNLRSGKKVSLLFSPASSPKCNAASSSSNSDDLMSFSPANK